MIQFPIALQAYSLREEMAADFEGTLAAIAEMGYNGVEFAGLFGRDVSALRDYLQTLQLTPISAHVAYDEMMKDPEAVLSAYKALGCRYVAIPYLNEEQRPGGPAFEKTLAGIEQLGLLAAQKEMQLLYHNHDFEFQTVNGEYLLNQLYRMTDPHLLASELDVCWVSVGGENPAAYIKQYAGRAPVVHLKDYAGGKTAHMYDLIGLPPAQQKEEEAPFAMRPVGQGILPFPEVLKACKAAGTQWVVVEQDTPTAGKTAMQCARESIAYLHALTVREAE